MSANSEWKERAWKVLSGAQNNLDGSGVAPRFIVKGKGAHLWDADGKEYLDFSLSAGPAIFGHNNAEYTKAIKDQMATLYALVSNIVQQSTLEVELAEKILEHVPCSERIHFNSSGTESVQFAIRLARASTGRRYFIRFERHYHGWMDNVLGGVVNDKPGGRPFPIENNQIRGIDGRAEGTGGRDTAAFEQGFLLPWNDIQALEKTLERYGKEVAMVIMEPILCNSGCCPPRPGYLEKVRELCTKYGIVLCFDEVITGFRVALNSAQGLFGVTPDITIFGKAITAGFPLAVVAGKKEIMDLIRERRTIIGGTYSRYPIGMAAGITTIKLLEKDNGAFYRKIDSLQKPLMEGLKEISQRLGIPMFVQGTRGVFLTRFINIGKGVAYSPREFVGVDMKKEYRWGQLMAEEGCLLQVGGRWYICSALTEADITQALECAQHAMTRLRHEYEKV